MPLETAQLAPLESTAAESSPAPVPQRPRWLLIVVGLCGIGLMVVAWQRSLHDGLEHPGIDYHQMWIAGKCVATRVPGELYSSEWRLLCAEFVLQHALGPNGGQREFNAGKSRFEIGDGRPEMVMDTFASPLLLALVHLTASENYEHDYWRFQAFSTACFLAAVVAWSRFAGYSWSVSLLLAGLFTYLGWFTWWDNVIANINRVQLAGLVAIGLGLGGLRFPAVTVSLSLAFTLMMLAKPNLAPGLIAVLLVLVIDRRWSRLAWWAVGTGLAGVFAAVLQQLAFGQLAGWPEWLRAVGELYRDARTFDEGNMSLVKSLSTLWNFDVGRPAALLGFVLLLVVLWLSRRGGSPTNGDDGWRGRDHCRLVFAMLVLQTWSIFSNRLIWIHYFVLLLPLFLALPSFAGVRPRWGRILLPSGWDLLAILASLLFCGAVIEPYSLFLQSIVIHLLGLGLIGAGCWIIVTRGAMTPAPPRL